MMLPGLFVVVGTLSVSVSNEPQWQRYTPPDARFEVTMPSKPSVSVKYVEKGSTLLEVYTASAHRDNGDGFPFNGTNDDFLVSWTDYSKAPKTPLGNEKTLNAMRDALANAKSAVVTCDHPVRLNGATGRSVTLRTEDGDIVDVLFYVTRTRVYQVMAETRSGTEHGRDRARFLQSFKLNS
jgi:hypothetical protein